MNTRENTRERERDQTHSYWYIPSTPRVNYSLLVMDSAGMMKMASGDGIPLRQGAGTGSRLVLVATEACGGETPDLGYVLGVSVYIRGFGVGNKSGGSMRRPRGRGAHPEGRARPHPRGGLGTLLVHLRYSVGFFWSKNNLREVSGQLDSVWFSFSAILKSKEKHKLAPGSRLIG